MKLKYFLWLLLPVVFSLLIYIFLPPVLESYLRETITEKLKENKVVSLDYDELSINLLPLTISFKNLGLTTNQVNQDSLPHITAQFPEIKISGISYSAYILDKTFSAKQISIERGKVQVSKRKKHFPVDSLNALLAFHVKDLSFPKNDLKAFSFDDHEIRLSQISAKTVDGFYQLNFEEIKSNGAKKLDLSFKNFKLIPQYPRYEFSRKKGFQTDRSEVLIPAISIHQIHLDSLLNQHYFHASAISMDSMQVNLFRDKNVPMNPDRFVVLPQQIIREMSLKFTIDSISLSNGMVTYEELKPDGKAPGKVFFDGLNATSHALSNDPNHFSNGQLDIKASGNLMGKGSVTADFHFNIFREDNQFNFKGTIGEMYLPQLNPMVENVAFVHLKSGQMKKMEFSVTANENFSIGNLNFYYHDLHASMIHPKKNENANFFKKIIFDLMETLIIPKENIAGKKFRKGTIKFNRDKQKSIVNYWWKSIFSGIQSTVGL
ncbi:DUF748 domain-containing protein [Flexithrix dorotheae]|uniref:DUF748 domain-containing protein n=1 Tax=Flexithrix dorotheae TaxID=70993 RepID=UPI0003629EFF|nr:DUF748 domain-containing protein [Flexithrix dorotheae]